MDRKFEGLPVSILLDDMLFAQNKADHMATLTEVLERCSKAGIRLEPSKCQFMLQEVDWLNIFPNLKLI